MHKLPKGRYTKEFREPAVKRVLEEGLSLREAGNRLSLPWKTLPHGVAAARAGTLGEVGSPQRPSPSWRRSWRGSSGSWRR
jgi:transposase